MSRVLTIALGLAAFGAFMAFLLALAPSFSPGLASLRDRVGPSAFDSTVSVLAAVFLLGALFSAEARRLQASKEMALVAMVVALGAAGRLLFAAAPNVSPVDWLTLCTGIVFGPMTGFTVGAGIMLVSNFWLGQGPWTIYQMVGMGSLGILGAGLGRWRVFLTRWALAAIGLAWGFVYGVIMSIFWMLIVSSVMNMASFVGYFISSLPFCFLQGTGNAVLLYFLGEQTIKVFERYRRRLLTEFLEGTPAGGASD